MALLKLVESDLDGTHLSSSHGSRIREKFNAVIDALGDIDGLLAGIPGATDLVGAMNALAGLMLQRERVATGTANIGAADTSVAIDLGTDVFDGKFAVVGFAADPLASGKVWAGAVAGSILTINVDAAPGGAGTVVSYLLVDPA